MRRRADVLAGPKQSTGLVEMGLHRPCLGGLPRILADRHPSDATHGRAPHAEAGRMAHDGARRAVFEAASRLGVADRDGEDQESGGDRGGEQTHVLNFQQVGPLQIRPRD
jgi:hypothetical protein